MAKMPLKEEQIAPDDMLLEAQRNALSVGVKAEREGRRVIYIHGRPYADPADRSNSRRRQRCSSLSSMPIAVMTKV